MTGLSGKVALITGAAQGIGAEIARQFAREGAAVAVNYRASSARAEAIVAAIQAEGGNAIALQGDVTAAASAADLVRNTISHFGHLDVLVNNAGIYEYGTLPEITEHSFRWHFDTNVLGVLLMAQAARPHLVASGGSIINIGSLASRALPATTTLYSASKAALDAVTRTLAKELGPDGVRINTVAPGAIRTEGVVDAGLLGGDWEKMLVAMTPLGRLGETDDIAPVVTFLASPGARWITGEIIYVGGGS